MDGERWGVVTVLGGSSWLGGEDSVLR
jgi:hypothetical protein